MVIRCDTCKGSGWITHPLWKEFFQVAWKPNMDDEEFDRWWIEREIPPFDPPPKKILCPECGGAGVLLWDPGKGKFVRPDTLEG